MLGGKNVKNWVILLNTFDLRNPSCGGRTSSLAQDVVVTSGFLENLKKDGNCPKKPGFPGRKTRRKNRPSTGWRACRLIAPLQAHDIQVVHRPSNEVGEHEAHRLLMVSARQMDGHWQRGTAARPRCAGAAPSPCGHETGFEVSIKTLARDDESHESLLDVSVTPASNPRSWEP